MPLIKDEDGEIKKITWSQVFDAYMECYFRLGLLWKLNKMLKLDKSQEEREGDANDGR